MQDKKTEAAVDRGERQEVWSEKKVRRILKELDESGEQVAQFARRHGWTPQRIHWWMSKLGWKRSSPVTAKGKVVATPPKFVPVRVVEERRPGVAALATRGSGVVLELAPGRLIQLERGFDDEVLLRVLQVLEGAPC